MHKTLTAPGKKSNTKKEDEPQRGRERGEDLVYLVRRFGQGGISSRSGNKMWCYLEDGVMKVVFILILILNLDLEHCLVNVFVTLLPALQPFCW